MLLTLYLIGCVVGLVGTLLPDRTLALWTGAASLADAGQARFIGHQTGTSTGTGSTLSPPWQTKTPAGAGLF